jgi:hypothetical protein
MCLKTINHHDITVSLAKTDFHLTEIKGFVICTNSNITSLRQLFNLPVLLLWPWPLL